MVYFTMLADTQYLLITEFTALTLCAPARAGALHQEAGGTRPQMYLRHCESSANTPLLDASVGSKESTLSSNINDAVHGQQ